MERKSFVACEWINRRKYYPVIKRTRDVGWIWKALCLVIEYILKYMFSRNSLIWELLISFIKLL